MKISLTIIIGFFTFSLFGEVPSDSLALTTPEGVAAKMLEFISCEKGEEKDWDEYRNLFLPSAQKLSYRPMQGQSISRQTKSMNIEEFVRYAGPNYPAKGFEEIVIGLEVNEFNGIANVFQSFYCKTPDGSYEARGVNSYQLVYLNQRWWIAHTMFSNETEDVKLPNKYLFKEYQSSEE